MPDQLILEVRLPEEHKKVVVPQAKAHERLTELLRWAGIPLNTRCGQRGVCSGCTVELTGGRVARSNGVETIGDPERPVLLRACQYHAVAGEPVRMRVPSRSLLWQPPHVVSWFSINIPHALSPLWQSVKLEDRDFKSDDYTQEDISRALAARLPSHGVVQCPGHMTEHIAHLLARSAAYVGLDYRADHWLVTEVSEQPRGPGLGAAIDVGTTTVALLLISLETGEILAEVTEVNQQIEFGDDVVTRIELCATDTNLVKTLQEAIVRATLSPMLDRVLRDARRSPDEVACLTVAGNSTMLHLLAGVDPTPMGTAPFTPAFLRHRVVRSAALGLGDSAASGLESPTGEHATADGGAGTALNPGLRGGGAAVHLLPGAAAYIGADVCAGVLSSGLLYDDGPSLLVDVGTNGEVVLTHNARLLGCATAAGPAFEGCGLTCGTRAVDGAINHLRFTGEPATIHAEVIGGGTTTGLCGSAYIDFLAQARRRDIINQIGRFSLSSLSDDMKQCLRQTESGLAFCVTEDAGHDPIVISETDVSRLLQAKAAIAAGILVLLERCALSPEDVNTLYLAGGFGLHIDPASAVGCGLLPGFTSQQVRPVGNSCLAGASLALLDSGVLEELERLSRRVEVVELNLDPGFETCYVDQLQLP